MINPPFNVIQISDSHLYGDQTRSLLGVNTNESFQAVIKHLKETTEKIDFILHTGDLSQDGSKESYLRLAEIFEQLNVPTYCLPGNHDNVRMMSQVYPLQNVSMHRHIVLKNWHFILLNSQVPGAVHGHLDQSQLDYLQHCLQTYPEHEAVIAFHHQPIPVECEWLDQSKLNNPEALWEVVSHYPKVNTILFGHVHQDLMYMVNKIKVISAPATCFQFKIKHQAFALDPIPPGFRLLSFHPDGRVETKVKRIDRYIGYFDKDATGY